MRHLRSTVLLAAAAVAGCGESGPPVPVATSIALSSTTVTLAALGASQQLTATVKDQSGQAMTGQPITWNVANPAVATASAGLVTAVGNGQTQVTAASGSLSASATVTVTQVVTQLAKTAGDAQSGTVGAQLTTALEVEARDSRGNAVPGAVATASVAFAVTQGNGSVTQTSVPIGANGRAATQFTLGTAAGTSHRVTASLTGGAISAQFTATAAAAPADTLAYVSGDGQTAPKGASAPQPLIVRVADQYGNPVPNYQVNFVTADGGSFTPASAVSGGNGQASAVWMLGAAVGTQTAEAQASTAITGSPVAFTATAIDFAITAIAPDTIVEGAVATITGMGFNTTPANNTVMIGGVAATVTGATGTSLTVTVPSFSCQPARAVNVQVTVDGAGSNTLSHPLHPAAFVNLAVGEQQIILDPASFCLQFDASAASEAYLVGVQSLSETPSTLTATRLIAGTGFPSPAPSGLPLGPLVTQQVAARTIPLSPRSARWLGHRRAEASVLDENARIVSAMPISAALPRTPAAPSGFVGPGVSVGDTVRNLRVSDGGATCGTYDTITTVARAKGQRSIWLEDVANPANGYTSADFDSLSKYMDNVIFDTDTSYFGSPGDRDGNGRIVVIVTKRVNQRSTTLLGFVSSCDFYTRASAPSSNEGELFYARAPDPTGIYGSVYARSDAFLDAPFLIGHEFTHIIQFAVRLPLAGAQFTSWILEGQATLAEEVVGHARTGRMPGQNYGFSVAFNTPSSTDIDWYSDGFVDLAVYFGFLTSTTRVAQAPHECTWIGRQSEGNTGPCLSGREVYGVPWSLLRWVSDQFGPGYAGGEQGLQKAIVLNPSGGYSNLAGTVGVSIDTLLAQWSAMLYVDDRVLGAAQRLTLPSWNMLDIFSHIVASGNLQPAEVGFAAFDQARNVRAGSTAYFRISGTARPATAIRARSSTDTALPGQMNVWIVRLQ